LPIDDVEWRDLAPEIRRQRILDSVKRLMLREAQVQPLLLIFEDLHWVDSETQVLLDVLVESLPATKLLLLTNYRPEYQQRWSARTFYTQLTLDTLPAQSAMQLLENLLGTDPTLEPLKHSLVTSTEGNPFFLEECVRTLIETGALAGERGASRFTQPVSMLRLPATVQAMLAARIDRLEPEEKNLLQVVAVIGKDVPHSLLREVADCAEEQLVQRLHKLQSSEYLYQAQLFPDLEYTFKHALTHEVAYAAVLQDKRRTLHARIAQAIERVYAQRLAEQVERLAHHTLRGEQWDKALNYLRRAGERAYRRSAHQEAVGAFDHAMEALSHLQPSREGNEFAVDLRLAVRHSLHQLGDQARIRELMRQAEVHAKALDDPRRLAMVLSYSSDALNNMGEADLAGQYGREALSLADSLDARDLQACAHFFLAMERLFRGCYREAVEQFQRNLERIERGSIGQPSEDPSYGLFIYNPVRYRPFTHMFLSRALAEIGNFDEAMSHAEHSLRAAEALGLPFGLGLAYHGIGFVYLRSGQFEQALPHLERSEQMSRSAELPLLFTHVAPSLGSTYVGLKRTEEAIVILEAGRQVAESKQLRIELGRAMVNLAEAYSLAGRADEALIMSQNALDFALERSQRGTEAWALYVRGNVCASAGSRQLNEAGNAYQRALAVADELGMRPLSAQCRLALGGVQGQVGQVDRGRAQLNDAIGMFHEMGMQYWVGKGESMLKAS
jgi:tetratricopeptide (TPR) repeat protein